VDPEHGRARGAGAVGVEVEVLDGQGAAGFKAATALAMMNRLCSSSWLWRIWETQMKS